MQTMDTSIVQKVLAMWTEEDTQKLINRYEKEIKANQEALKANQDL